MLYYSATKARGVIGAVTAANELFDLKELPKARATYQKFVMVAPDSPHVPEIRALVGELDKLIADLDAPETVVAQPANPKSPPRNANEP